MLGIRLRDLVAHLLCYPRMELRTSESGDERRTEECRIRDKGDEKTYASANANQRRQSSLVES